MYIVQRCPLGFVKCVLYVSIYSIRLNIYISFTAAQKRKRLTLQEKVEIINVYEKERLSVVRDMTAWFSVGKTQISDILRNKKKKVIVKSWTENKNLAGKRSFPKTSGL